MKQQRGRGRPELPPEERAVTKVLRYKVRLWEELEELVPRGKRSAFLNAALEAALKRLRRQRERDAAQTEAEGGIP
jgi:hypothetical protein